MKTTLDTTLREIFTHGITEAELSAWPALSIILEFVTKDDIKGELESLLEGTPALRRLRSDRELMADLCEDVYERLYIPEETRWDCAERYFDEEELCDDSESE